MFSGILKDLAGYIDRRTFATAFFPSLLFWAVIALMLTGSDAVRVTFGHATTPQQILWFVVFVVVVTLWTLLVRSFQPILLQLYEGALPSPTSSRAYRWLRRSRQTLLRGEQAHIAELQEVENALAETHRNLNKARADAGSGSRPTNKDIETLNEIENYVRSLSRLRPDKAHIGHRAWWLWSKPIDLVPTVTITGTKDIEALCATAKNLAQPPLPGEPKAITDKRWGWGKRLDACLTRVGEAVGEVHVKRIEHEAAMRQSYPSSLAATMPTRLGNVLRAAETDIEARYGMTVDVIWPRIQAVLPKESSDALLDAKDAVDLRITLSAHFVLLSVIVSAWLLLTPPRTLAVYLNSPMGENVIVAAVILGVPLLISVLLFGYLNSWYWRYFLAYVSSIVILSLATLGAGLSLSARLPQPLHNLGNALFVLIVLASVASVILLLLVWPTYFVAVQAALVYANLVRTFVDLHRFDLLQGLHLQTPPDLKEERQMWIVVSGALAEGKIPESDYPRYYSYTGTEATGETVGGLYRGPLPVAAADLPAMRQIVRGDLVSAPPPRIGEGPTPLDGDEASFINNMDDAEDKYALSPLPAGQPIKRATLATAAEVKGLAVTAIQATPAMMQGGAIRPGMSVSLIVVPPASTDPTSVVPPTCTFDDVKVLDALQASGVKGDDTAVGACTLLIALSTDQCEKFAIASVGANIIIVRKFI